MMIKLIRIDDSIKTEREPENNRPKKLLIKGDKNGKE